MKKLLVLLALLTLLVAAPGVLALTFSPATVQKLHVNVPFTLNLANVTTEANGTVSYSYSASPDWTTFKLNTTTGMVSFTPTDADFVWHKVTLTATDNVTTASSAVEFYITETTDNGNLTFTSDFTVDDMTGDDSELNPGDTIELSGDYLKNMMSTVDMSNIKVKAWLEDSSGTRVTDRVEPDSFDLSSKDTYGETLDLVVPVDAKDGKLYLVVSAEGTDSKDATQSALHVKELEVTRQDHDIAFDSVIANPDTAACGQSFDVVTDIWNTGTHDESTKLRVQSTDLSIDFYSDFFTLKHSGSDAEGVITMPVLLGNVKPGNYTLTVSANYNSGKDIESTSANVKVVCSSYVSGTNNTSTGGTGALTFADISMDGKQGQQAKFTGTLKNTGTTAASYTFELTGISDWAAGYVEPDTVTVAAGANTEIFVYVTPKTSATGDKTVTLTAKSGGTVIETETLTVKLPEKPTLSITSLGSLSDIDNTAALVIIVGVLIVVGLLFLGRKRAATSAVATYGKKRGRNSEEE